MLLPVAEGLADRPGEGARLINGNGHARLTKAVDASGGGGAPVPLADDHASDSCIDERLAAGAGAPGVVARFERDEGGGAVRGGAGPAQRVDLRVRTAAAPVVPLAHDPSVRIDDDAADHGVRLRPAVSAHGKASGVREIPAVTSVIGRHEVG